VKIRKMNNLSRTGNDTVITGSQITSAADIRWRTVRHRVTNGWCDEKDAIMKNLLLAAAAATLVFAGAPAFASPSDDAQWGITAQPLAGSCHFVSEPETMPNGHVVYREVQVCP
jgi:hypothetical protein